ncbi:MAG: diguanylate cyclase [Planctomycetota bacterium]|jgi:diguanylate cyclase (GGDEF)-like protein
MTDKMNKTVERQKGIVSVNSSETVAKAAVKMQANKVACLIVTDDNGKFAGIITEQDIVNRAVAPLADVEQTTVGQIMTPQVISGSPGIETSKAREIMAANRIRHLPIVKDQTVVGMLSIRDVLEQQLTEDRAAAEQVAALSSCLRSIDLDEVVNIITVEVPRLFQAKKCVLLLHSDETVAQGHRLVSFNGCMCCEKDLECTEDTTAFGNGCELDHANMPEVCERQGAKWPRVVVPLTTSGLQEHPSGRGDLLSGRLCMCDLDPSASANKELISYKARLIKEVLNSHLTNVMLYQEARLTSLTDALTNVGSRKLLEDKLEAECARAERYNRSFSVGIIDLDNFKTINDVLGHAAGDNALRKLAQCLKNNERAADTLARYGGDEFVVLMPETKAIDACTLMERLRAKVQEINIAENVSTTISCGIAEWLPDESDSGSEVLRRADLALYEAKSSGRDCISVWHATMSKALRDGELEEEKIRRLRRRIAGLSEQSEKMFIQSIWGLVQALEAKDAYAKKHSENVMYYSVGIAEAMEIAPKQIEVIERAAMIHDIGKIGVPDAILSKPDTLTRRERSVVEQHPLIAVRILSKMEFLEQEIAIVRNHHEKWNGQGYPDGLSATSIPLGARVMAAADTLDALTSNRSYHKSRSVAEAIKIIVDSSSYDFDPKVVEGLVSWLEKISNQLGKEKEQLTPGDLVGSQERLEHSPAPPVVVGPSM